MNATAMIRRCMELQAEGLTPYNVDTNRGPEQVPITPPEFPCPSDTGLEDRIGLQYGTITGLQDEIDAARTLLEDA